jgi:hypothetical protein
MGREEGHLPESDRDESARLNHPRYYLGWIPRAHQVDACVGVFVPSRLLVQDEL